MAPIPGRSASLIKPHQRQPLTPWLALVLLQQPLEVGDVCAQPRHRLHFALVAERSIFGFNRLADRLPRHVRPARDLHPALPQPDVLRHGLSARDPGDGVRRPCPRVRLLRRRHQQLDAQSWRQGHGGESS
jgi:hypothetical protein